MLGYFLVFIRGKLFAIPLKLGMFHSAGTHGKLGIALSRPLNQHGGKLVHAVIQFTFVLYLLGALRERLVKYRATLFGNIGHSILQACIHADGPPAFRMVPSHTPQGQVRSCPGGPIPPSLPSLPVWPTLPPGGLEKTDARRTDTLTCVPVIIGVSRRRIAVKNFPACIRNVALLGQTRKNGAVSMNASSATLTIAISEDGLTASLADPITFPPARFSPATVRYALAQAGVQVEPEPGALDRLCTSVVNGQAAGGYVLVRGTPPQPARDAVFTPEGDLRYPVFPGSRVGHLTPGTSALPGISVTGDPLSPPGPATGTPIILPDNSYCHYDRVTGEIRAERYGLMVREACRLFLRPLIAVSEDGMRAEATLYRHDHRGKPVSADRLAEALRTQGIVAPLHRSAFAAAMQRLIESGEDNCTAPVAFGKRPVHGKNGWFEQYVQDDRSAVGQLGADGTMNYRERGIIRSVPADVRIGKLHAPTRGNAGKTVLGALVPPREGTVLHITTGENVVATETGSEFLSQSAGMIFFAKNTLSVTEVFTTQGNVDMSTGNLKLERGSVHVRGAVLSGFGVSCPRNILVEDTVESATISAGGHVEVRGGIVMDREGTISAGGSVSAIYAKGATIEAGEDVVISHALDNCTVFAGRDVLATAGRGRITGSTVRCAGSVSANEVGSELGVATTILLGLEPPASVHLPRKRELESMLNKIRATLGAGNPRAILAATPPTRKSAVARLLRTRLAAEVELENLAKAMEQEKEALRQGPRSELLVYRTIHPGVVIQSMGVVMRITTAMEHSRIFYCPDERKIISTSL